MDLADLLLELRENILHDRSDRVSGSADYLWTDATLVRYINEACRRFARRGLVIRDGSNVEATQITLKTGIEEYALHDSVLGVISARAAGDTNDLTRTGHATLDTYQLPDTVFFDPNAVAKLPPGKPLAFTTDEFLSTNCDDSTAAATLRIYPAPSATYNDTKVNLRVVRLPIENLTVDDMTAKPEISEEHHIEMLDWAAYLALRIVDDDVGAPKRAEEFRNSFEVHVQDARKVAMRKLYVPQTWKFGGNGFGWEQGHG